MERETTEANQGEGIRVSDPISLTLPSSPGYVLLARLVVAQVGRLAGFGPEEVYGNRKDDGGVLVYRYLSHSLKEP